VETMQILKGMQRSVSDTIIMAQGCLGQLGYRRALMTYL
jgi:hypothetical protein